MKSKAAKIRELLMKELPAKDIAAKLNVPLSTVYTTKWKMKNTKPTAEGKAKVKRILDRAKPSSGPRNPALVPYLMKELETTNKLISDAEAIRVYLQVRIREVLSDRV